MVASTVLPAQYGVHSACSPEATAYVRKGFLCGNYALYREVSEQVREIFAVYGYYRNPFYR